MEKLEAVAKDLEELKKVIANLHSDLEEVGKDKKLEIVQLTAYSYGLIADFECLMDKVEECVKVEKLIYEETKNMTLQEKEKFCEAKFGVLTSESIG